LVAGASAVSSDFKVSNMLLVFFNKLPEASMVGAYVTGEGSHGVNLVQQTVV
jgi:hypothetical protein